MLDEQQINSIHQLLDEVADRQRSDFGNIISDIKSDGTLITECDRWSDSKLVEGLSKITNNSGVLSEEGSKTVPNSDNFWVVDPLDGTTNFAAGIPYWAISAAHFVDGEPQTAFLDIPALKKRFVAIKGRGVLLNNQSLSIKTRCVHNSQCVSLCSRSIRILQKRPDNPFPGKIRLLGVASLNMTSVAIGQTIAALEATPKIWDLASAWLVLTELSCPIKWLARNPSNIEKGQNLATASFPVLVATSDHELNKLLPWGNLLIDK
tara:strand:+ start:720 stop:1511 length:792 start_codon:yes stop_codon:yes gene_type:complete